ncbi:hypothetical protein GUJ93_ZPchr0012g20707 [Zizania palustris]|uniref:non-specific serine/threonine protein kinase n=1 Tax=Zizania palustris TaxID=103762 RepID=A0A8J5WNE4_ZIZPA|nr:hypothetical protein GUJ93_ZPchr0012g20707 [Zizania palustris]
MEIPGVESVTMDIPNNQVTVTGPMATDPDLLAASLRTRGNQVVSIVSAPFREITRRKNIATLNAISRQPSKLNAAYHFRTFNRFGTVALSDVRFVRRLGSGDIGSVYLAEVKGKGGDGGGSGSGGVAALVAAKVMDRKELAGRNKEGRARTEREILESTENTSDGERGSNSNPSCGSRSCLSRVHPQAASINQCSDSSGEGEGPRHVGPVPMDLPPLSHQALFGAVRSADAAAVGRLLADAEASGSTPALAAAVTDAGETALYVAAEAGSEEVVRLLIPLYDFEAATIRSRLDLDAFHVAAKQGHTGELCLPPI